MPKLGARERLMLLKLSCLFVEQVNWNPQHRFIRTALALTGPIVESMIVNGSDNDCINREFVIATCSNLGGFRGMWSGVAPLQPGGFSNDITVSSVGKNRQECTHISLAKENSASPGPPEEKETKMMTRGLRTTELRKKTIERNTGLQWDKPPRKATWSWSHPAPHASVATRVDPHKLSNNNEINGGGNIVNNNCGIDDGNINVNGNSDQINVTSGNVSSNGSQASINSNSNNGSSSQSEVTCTTSIPRDPAFTALVVFVVLLAVLLVGTFTLWMRERRRYLRLRRTLVAIGAREAEAEEVGAEHLSVRVADRNSLQAFTTSGVGRPRSRTGTSASMVDPISVPFCPLERTD
ncbi:hypothetical protein K438DRAFT_2086529 [Mycena galopus ATCC 62051]|nr:hypothetical protein K438DRAFT_2086529 [Mycena galopus ATCC 62051]